MKRKNWWKPSNELDLIWLKLGHLEKILEKAEDDLKAARNTIEYITQRIEKLRNQYKPKHVTPITKEAEKE